MKPISTDLRKRVVAARYLDGQSMGQIAERFKMPKGTVQNIIERYRDSGTVEPKPQNPGRKSSFCAEDLALLDQDVQKHPDATLEELRARSCVKVSVVAFHNTLKKLGYTRKKNRYVRESNYVQM
jgi:transposase